MNIIIAGATGDIGKAITISISQHLPEAKLLLLYRDQEKKALLSKQLSPSNTQFLCIQHPFQNKDIIFNTFLKFQPQIFICAIGDGFYAKVENVDLEELDKSYEANFKIPFFLAQLAYKIFLPQKKGHIIFINSISALEGFPYGSLYCPFKFALKGAAEVMAKEGKRYGLKVSSIYPGIVKTKLLDKMPFVPKKGLLNPEDVAQAVLYLLKLSPYAEVKDLLLKNNNLAWR
ncbi:MAG: SDR family oxidoreductase [Desulfonauticus sp.]|nr:SDR family oxidoreductase [Desulfonauticus sp.]